MTWDAFTVIAALLTLGLVVLVYRVYLSPRRDGAHRGARHDLPADTAPAAPGEDAIAQTIAGATAAGYLGAETISIAPVSGTPPWAVHPPSADATVTLVWPEPVAEELVPLPPIAESPPDRQPRAFEARTGTRSMDANALDRTTSDKTGRWAPSGPGSDTTGAPRPWEPGAEVQGVVVEPGWGEPDDAGWAETTFPGLLDGLTSYAYPDGFPPRRDTTERYDLLFGTAPWTGGGDPASAARLDALVFELLKTPDLDADRVFALMGGNS